MAVAHHAAFGKKTLFDNVSTVQRFQGSFPLTCAQNCGGLRGEYGSCFLSPFESSSAWCRKSFSLEHSASSSGGECSQLIGQGLWVSECTHDCISEWDFHTRVVAHPPICMSWEGPIRIQKRNDNKHAQGVERSQASYCSNNINRYKSIRKSYEPKRSPNCTVMVPLRNLCIVSCGKWYKECKSSTTSS